MTECDVGKILGLPVRVAPLRSTYVKDLGKCPRLFLLQDRVGLHRIGFDRALDFGTLVHKMLQELFLGHTGPRAELACRALYEETKEKLTGQAITGLLPGGVSLDSVLAEAEVNLWKAIAAALVFWETNPFPLGEYSVVETDGGVPLIEYPVNGGTIDLVLYKKGTYDVWIVDHKTTSIQPSVRAQALTISPQFQLYRRGLQTLLDSWGGRWADWKVAGIICNVIKTPGIKYCPGTKDADFLAYLERLREWYRKEEDPPMLQVFHRWPESDPLSEEELTNQIFRYGLAAHEFPKLPLFPRAGDYTCHEFNRACPFLPFCTSDPVTWKSRIRTADNPHGDYEVRFREDEEEKPCNQPS